MTAVWARRPACSRSLLVITPDGLSLDTRESWMSRGKGNLQRKASPWLSKYVPPMPALAASVVPKRVGSSGTISARCVGREDKSAANSLKVSM